MATNLKRRKPETIQIEKDLYILWRDGHESRYSFFSLRDACPCAACVDELTGEKRLATESIPKDIFIRRSEYIGNYALRVEWSDGHSTGLYSFRFLRQLCSCSICAAAAQE